MRAQAPKAWKEKTSGPSRRPSAMFGLGTADDLDVAVALYDYSTCALLRATLH